MLRKQIPENYAAFADPTEGVNLRDSLEGLRDGESPFMQNCEWYGTTRIRRGSRRVNSASLSASQIKGGTKFYFGGTAPQGKRLIAYSNRVSVLDDVGAETVLDSGMTAGQDTFFATWSITDSCYVSNKVDVLRRYNGTTFVTIGGTNVPIPRSAVVPVLDRLLCITTAGIERTNPRVDNIWSGNSSWATLRPQAPGLFTALHPYTMRGTDTFYPGAIAFQERAHYLISGTQYGSDVTALSATNDDASIRLLDPTVGTASPYSVCTVPGVGMFWFTADFNVYWLPEGSLTGQYIGDKIQSTGTTQGIESVNPAQLSQVWMTYFDHILMLGIPIGTNTFATTQWWCDMRALRAKQRPVWYGPMTGQSVGRVWVENQQGDNRVMGAEGNAGNGAFVYQLRVPARFTDAVGTTDTAISLVYQTPFKSYGVPSREKYVQAVHMDLNAFTGTATLDLLDLDGTLASGLSIDAVT